MPIPRMATAGHGVPWRDISTSWIFDARVDTWLMNQESQLSQIGHDGPLGRRLAGAGQISPIIGSK